MAKLKIFLILYVFLCATVSLQGQSLGYQKTVNGFQQSYLDEATGDLQSAINELKEVYDEQSYEVNLRLGWLKYSSGDFTESSAFYRKAVDLKPFAIEPRFGLIYPLAAMGNWDAVISQYEKILEIAPGNTVAMHRLGLVYYGRDDFETAEKLFSKVVNLYPFDYDALIMLAWTNLELKKYREAKVLFNKALMHSPGGQSALDGLKLLD